MVRPVADPTPTLPAPPDRPEPQPRPLGAATLAGLGAIVLWSGTVALGRSLSEKVGSLTGGGATYILGGLLYLGWWATRHRSLTTTASAPSPSRDVSRARWSRHLLCGGLFAGYALLLFLALGRAHGREQVLTVGLINYLWPPLTVLFAVPILGKTARWMLGPGLLLALAGMTLVMFQEQVAARSWSSVGIGLRSNPLPLGLAAAAAMAWALYSNLVRRLGGGHGSGMEVGLYELAAGGLLLAARLFLPENGAWTSTALLEASALGTATAVAYGLWDWSMRRGNLILVASFSYLTPLLSTLVSCLYLSVEPGPVLWLGCGLLILGSITSHKSVTD